MKDKYPHLWAFFNGAFQANSGGRVSEKDLSSFTEEQLNRAEVELRNFNRYHPLTETGQALLFSQWLGAMADQGYTVSGQTEQELTDGNDDRHVLLAFDLLEEIY